MSDYTSKLNLYKVDPTIDGEEKFNIKTMMNNNWDKIDTKVSEIDQKLSGIEDNANNYKHPSTHNADMINIQDADGKFSSGNVEGALQEVGASMVDIAYKQATIIQDVDITKDNINDVLYKNVGGSANAVTVTKKGFTLTSGKYVEFKAKYTNTSSVTIKINDLSTKSLKNEDGWSLTAGDIEKNKYYKAIYNGSFFVLASKGGMKINSVETNNYIVNAGQPIKAGDLVQFVNNKVSLPSKNFTNGMGLSSKYAFGSDESPCNTSVIQLSSTKVLACYYDSDSNSKNSKAVVLNISGNTITSGSKYVFCNGRAEDIDVIQLNSSKAIVTYSDRSNNGYGTSIILNISGNNITSGSKYVFNTGGTSDIATAKLDSSKILVCYRDNSNNRYGTAVVLSIYGNSISKGSNYIFASRRVFSTMSAVQLSYSKICLSYKNESDTYYSTVILNVNGNNVTKGRVRSLDSLEARYVTLIKLDSSKILAYYMKGSSNQGAVSIIKVSGDEISTYSNNIFIFNRGYTGNISFAKIDSSKILINYTKGGGSGEGSNIIMLHISGDTVTKGSPYTISTNDTYCTTTVLNPTKVLMCFGQRTGSVATILSAVKPLQGLALQNGSGGQTIKCYDFRN
jgi:hypothetical protein